MGIVTKVATSNDIAPGTCSRAYKENNLISAGNDHSVQVMLFSVIQMSVGIGKQNK